MKNNFFKNKTIISLFLMLISLTYFSNSTIAQSTDKLYVSFENGLSKQLKKQTLAYSYDAEVFRNEMLYYFGYKLYYKDSPYFIVVSLNYASTSLVPMYSLSGLNIKTPEEVEAELEGMTSLQKQNYMYNLDHIYIVELYPATSQARIVEVRINIDIE
jgi:hypothetical protein